MLRILKLRNIVIIDIILFILLFLSLEYKAFGETTTITAGNNGRLWGVGTVYLTERNLTTADYLSTDRLAVGQRKTTDYYVYRSFFSFPIPSLISVTACSLCINGETDGSTTDFEIYVHSASGYKSTLTTADFDQFNGWQSSGAYNGTILNNTWNSSSYSADWNKIVFNAAGLDSVVAAKGDTLWIAIISKEDYNASEPTDDEYILFDSSEDSGTEPYLSLVYTTLSEMPRRQRLYNLTRRVLYDKRKIPLYNP